MPGQRRLFAPRFRLRPLYRFTARTRMDIAMHVAGLIAFAAFTHLFVRGFRISKKSKLLLGYSYCVLQRLNHERMGTGMACFGNRA